jgi:thiol-disulfide isomerase/thioredoxin
VNGHWSRREWLGALGLAALPGAARAAPAIEWPPLTDIDGQTIDPAGWQGVPAVVVFWATWCAFCRRHNAHVDKLHRSMPVNRLRIVGVVIDGDAASARRYMNAAGYGFPVVLDQGRLRQRFTPRRLIPMTCTVDRHGQLGQCFPGEMSEADVLEFARLALP